jgi:hypothetical protein
MNDDAETRKPATVSFATALGENTGGVVFGEYDVQAKRLRCYEEMRCEVRYGAV